MEKLYSTTEIANQLGVTSRTIRRWIREDKLKAISTGTKKYYHLRMSDVEKFINANSTNEASQ